MASEDNTQSKLLLYTTEDGRQRIEVILEEGTVWLNQNRMAELFQTTKQNISLSIRNIFTEGELTPDRAVKEYLTTATDGKITRPGFITWRRLSLGNTEFALIGGLSSDNRLLNG